MINFKDFYQNSVDIIISPEYEIICRFDTNKIPSKLYMSYCDVSGIEIFLNTELGSEIKDLIITNNTKLIIFPTDSVGITDTEFDYLFKSKEFFTHKNVKFYQSWYDSRLKFNYHFGSTIHSAMDFYINYVKTNKYNIIDKKYHFLTLNNKESPPRKKLYEFYINLPNNDKNKISCSFRFNGIDLDYIEGEEIHNFNQAYGNSLIQHYTNSFMEIVSESSLISITEKSYKPILSEVPFIYWNETHTSTNYQLKFFEDIGIDVNYFDIDYSNRNSISNKIIEILNTPQSDLFSKYNYAFALAAENKIKILNFIESLETEIIGYV